MRVLVAMSAHFGRHDGAVYSPMFSYGGFWSRYTAVFDEVLVVARVADIPSVPDGWDRACGNSVKFADIPEFRGAWQYLLRKKAVKKLIGEAILECDAFCLRLPSATGAIAFRTLMRMGLPYAVEVVGDPWLSFAPGANRSIVRPIARRRSRKSLREACRNASAALYVTDNALQRTYPPNPNAYSVGCSTVELPLSAVQTNHLSRLAAIDTIHSRLHLSNSPVRLGFIGTLDALYKAPDLHVRAVAECRRRGLNVELHIVGEGKYKDDMQRIAAMHEIESYIHFRGRLPAGEAVFSFLDGIDLFLNASRQDGLPRALVEAMARGCPAIGSNIAGIPELLDGPWLVEADDANALADRIQHILTSPDMLKRAVNDNSSRALAYCSDVLAKKRSQFYEHVRRISHAINL